MSVMWLNVLLEERYGVVRYTYGVVLDSAVKPIRRRIGSERSVASTWRYR